MIIGALFISFVMPLQISMKNFGFEPFAVKATIDAAIIVGLPPSKSARKQAFLKQTPEFIEKEADQAIKVVVLRKLFFRNYFH